jgi:N-acetyl-anhydromuramyl-L-alanine amidase AmpD
MQITKAILTKNPCYKAGKTIKVKGLMLHSVGCPQPSATAFIKSWNTPNASVCVHGFIDGNTGGVYQTLPWNRRGWHCGGDANGTHIGIEMCEPGCIKYTSGAKFTCSDKEKAKAVVERTYKSAVELFACLCNEYGLNPLAEGVILAHSEGYAKGLASNHADPEHLWKGLKLPYTMEGFRKDVKSAMNPTYYRVQVGAFTKEKNAKNLLAELAQKGFKGFIVKS